MTNFNTNYMGNINKIEYKGKEFIPSKYQQEIFDNILHGTSNMVINAVAGSGKSTTIVNALKLIPDSMNVLFIAFNKDIVETLKEKVRERNPDYFKIKIKEKEKIAGIPVITVDVFDSNSNKIDELRLAK